MLGWNGFDDDELRISADELNAYVERLRHVPRRVRHFLGVVAQRAYKMRDTNAVETGGILRGTKILASDLEAALRLSPQVIMERVTDLQAYGLGDLAKYPSGMKSISLPFAFETLKSGWPIWMDIAQFCDKAHEPMPSP